ncbi:TPA: zinc ribbon domain-containing protein [Streptococcus suis]
MGKFCQSYAMSLDLHVNDVRGIEVGGSISGMYCFYCYGNGAFWNPI